MDDLDSFEKKQHDNKNESDDDNEIEFSFVQSFKTLILVSLPHLAVLILFLFYALIGAAIIKEIEADGPVLARTAETNANADFDLSSVSSNFFDAKTFGELSSKYQASLVKINADTFNKLKSYQTRFNKNNKNLLTSLNSDLSKVLNLTHNAHTKVIGSSDKSTSNKISKKQLPLDPTSDHDETIKFLSTKLKLNNTAQQSSKKKKKSKNSDLVDSKELLRSIAEHIINYKGEIKFKLIDFFHDHIEDQEEDLAKIENEVNQILKSHENLVKSETISFNKNLEKLFSEAAIKSKLGEKIAFKLSAVSQTIDVKQSSAKKWTFSNSLYFVGSLLTQIGFGDLAPKTILGKLFIMIYLFIGIPLTLILLADFSSILSRYIKFIHLFIVVLKRDGYFERISSLFSFIYMFRPASSKKQANAAHHSSRTKSSSSDDLNDNKKSDDLDDENGESRGNRQHQQPVVHQNIFRSLIEIAFNCLEQTDDAFDLSLSSLFGLVFIYLTIGALVSSNLSNWSIFDGYYFCLIMLTKIGLGDLVVDDPKYVLASCFYTLFGLAFFTLTVQTLQEKLRLLIISNGQRIINEFIKFTNQLGYNFSSESMSQSLIGFCKGPQLFYVLEDDDKFEPNNLTSKFSNGVSASTSTPNIATSTNRVDYLDEDDDLFGPGKSSLSRSNSSHLLKRRLNRRTNTIKNLNDSRYDCMVNKCDKQTQITTLLCSRFKYDKDGIMMSSMGANLDRIGLSNPNLDEIFSAKQQIKKQESVDDFNVTQASSFAPLGKSSSSSLLKPNYFSHHASKEEETSPKKAEADVEEAITFKLTAAVTKSENPTTNESSVSESKSAVRRNRFANDSTSSKTSPTAPSTTTSSSRTSTTSTFRR